MTATINTARAAAFLSAVEASMERAASSCAPCAIFRAWSGIRVGGNATIRAQGHLVAMMALAYWLEALADKKLCPADIADFHKRALALKNDVDDFAMQQAIDGLLAAAGQLALSHPTILRGPQHAITAAYCATGSTDAAPAILIASNGVSGASMDGAVIP